MRHLPLSTNARPALTPNRESEVGALVARFYSLGRDDDLIGPIFDQVVSDWGTHLATMNDFWTSAMYRSGRYSGRPLEAHAGLGITRDHLDRWLVIWRRAVEETVTSEIKEDLIVFAERMGDAMLKRVGA